MRDDHQQADQETLARQHLLDAGASALPRPPWLHRSQPPASADLVRFALWRDRTGSLSDGEVEAALTLLPAARAEMKQLETAMLFTARAQGLSWARISRAMGLGSAQAAVQRFDRLTRRSDPRGHS